MGCFETNPNYHTQALQISLAPIVLVLLVWCVYAVRMTMFERHAWVKRQNAWNTACSLSILIAWLVLPNVVMVQVKSVSGGGA